jgi:hypothetical protein
MRARKLAGLHTKAGEAYHWVMLGVCMSAATLAVLDWNRIWWFLPVALGSYAFAFVGYLAAKRRWNGWLRVHVVGQGGSYIAMVTAVLIVNWEAWRRVALGVDPSHARGHTADRLAHARSRTGAPAEVLSRLAAAGAFLARVTSLCDAINRSGRPPP